MTNKKISQKRLQSSIMDKTVDKKRMKSVSSLPQNYFSTINLMEFIEIVPLNPTVKPHPRSGHRAIATDSDFWIWGGYHPSVNGQSRMFDEVENK